MFWNWVRAIFNGMLRAMREMLAYMLVTVIDLFNSLVTLFPEIGYPISDAQLQSVFDELAKWNQFVPLSEGFVLLALFLSFCVVYSAIRIIMSLIPGVA